MDPQMPVDWLLRETMFWLSDADEMPVKIEDHKEFMNELASRACQLWRLADSQRITIERLTKEKDEYEKVLTARWEEAK